MRNLSILATLALASGCATYSGSGIQPGAPEAQVLSVMGPPAMEMRDPDGTRHLYYPKGPLGNHTYVADIGANGALDGEIRNVLGDGVFNGIRPGMTSDEVLRRIGPPREKAHFARSNQTSWDYKYQDAWGYEAIFSVTFDASGIVVSKFSKRIDRYERGR